MKRIAVIFLCAALLLFLFINRWKSVRGTICDFDEKTENFFSSPEAYEEYYGFQRNWNEETGEILESVREYYNRGGKFTELPEKYPCVVYFSYCDIDNMSYKQDGLKWIYIGI